MLKIGWGGVMLYCSPACVLPWCWWVRGWCRLVNHHGSHGKEQGKAMRSMGPPHAYVCDLLMKLLHYPKFLETLCFICQSVTNSHTKDLYIFG